jgi:hypothetical protein
MIYPHHAAKVCWSIDKVTWRRAFKKICNYAQKDGHPISPEESMQNLGARNEEEEKLLEDEKFLEEKERRLGYFSAVKASREHQQKSNAGLLKVVWRD